MKFRKTLLVASSLVVALGGAALLFPTQFADAANPLFRISGAVTAGHMVTLNSPFVGVDGGAPNVAGNLTGTLPASVFGTTTITGQGINNVPVTTTDYVPYYNATDNAVRRITVGSLVSSGVAGVTTWNGRSGAVLPAASDYSFALLSGSLACSQRPALTGDVTASAGSCATVLAQIQSGVPFLGSLLGTAIAAPGTPAAGKGNVYIDSTSKALAIKTDGGVISHSVQSNAGAANNFLTAIADDGTVSRAQPSFANLSGSATGAQLPNPSASSLGGIQSLANVAHNWISSISTLGVPVATQPACSDLSGVAASCSTDATNAANITSGTLPNARIVSLPLANIATESANTVVANVTAGSAAPTAASLPSCADTSGNHLNYTNGTGFSCGTSSSQTGVDVQTFTSGTTNWTKPAGKTVATVIAFSGGAGGGSGQVAAATTVKGGGCGGGGGFRVVKQFRISDLGATESVTVGAAGTGGAVAGTGAGPGITGVAGGNTSFGSHFTVAGGGVATVPSAGGCTGGTGGGWGTAAAATTNGVAFEGGSGGTGTNASANTIWGGAGGGGASGASSGTAGGSSVYACAGGGTGGSESSGNALQQPTAGGTTGTMTPGGGGAAGSSVAGAPTVGTTPTIIGQGGGGGGSAQSIAGAAGGAAGICGGGGGGGSARSTFNSGAGGNGGAGLVYVISE